MLIDEWIIDERECPDQTDYRFENVEFSRNKRCEVRCTISNYCDWRNVANDALKALVFSTLERWAAPSMIVKLDPAI